MNAVTIFMDFYAGIITEAEALAQLQYIGEERPTIEHITLEQK